MQRTKNGDVHIFKIPSKSSPFLSLQILPLPLGGGGLRWEREEEKKETPSLLLSLLAPPPLRGGGYRRYLSPSRGRILFSKSSPSLWEGEDIGGGGEGAIGRPG